MTVSRIEEIQKKAAAVAKSYMIDRAKEKRQWIGRRCGK